tara:strand:+ start:2071 stop:2784 length:714 start_codon:yes stop_codon:yes gene_type:complete
MKLLVDSFISRYVMLVLSVTLCGVTVTSCNASSSLKNEELPYVDSENTVLHSRNNRLRIVAFGDSLTAGLGVSPDESYPARLQAVIDEAGYDFFVENAGVSGETTAGGLRRMDWVLNGDAEIVILALGGNDGLRGLPVEQMKDNLSKMIDIIRESGARVLLAGMEAPQNFGVEYTDAFRSVFQELADQHAVIFLPFLLDGVAGIPELNQPDGIHPNVRGAQRVSDNVWSVLELMISE